jgi:glycerophosphoryl diester phosphodiesterase
LSLVISSARNRATKTSEIDSPAAGLLASRRPLVIGHRGCCQFAPENTIPSFKLAIEAGADLVELDCRPSQDGALMVIHDDELDRTTDANKRWGRQRIRVDSKSAAEIQSLDAGSWFDVKFAGAKIPRLSESLDVIQTGSVALIERKAGGAAACVELLRAKKLISRVVVISFDWSYLRAFHELEPKQVLGALGPPGLLSNGRKPSGLSRKLSAARLDELQKTGARVVVWNRQVSRKTVQLAHERGLKVWIYTINEPALANRLLDIGVDGLISNNPSLIGKTLALRLAGPGAA